MPREYQRKQISQANDQSGSACLLVSTGQCILPVHVILLASDGELVKIDSLEVEVVNPRHGTDR